MSITVTLKPNIQRTHISVTFEDLGVTEEGWSKMGITERCELLQPFVDAENESNRPFFEIHDITTKP